MKSQHQEGGPKALLAKTGRAAAFGTACVKDKDALCCFSRLKHAPAHRPAFRLAGTVGPPIRLAEVLAGTSAGQVISAEPTLPPYRRMR